MHAGNPEVGPGLCELLWAPSVSFTGLTVMKCLLETRQQGKDALRENEKTSEHHMTSV